MLRELKAKFFVSETTIGKRPSSWGLRGVVLEIIELVTLIQRSNSKYFGTHHWFIIRISLWGETSWYHSHRWSENSLKKSIGNFCFSNKTLRRWYTECSVDYKLSQLVIQLLKAEGHKCNSEMYQTRFKIEIKKVFSAIILGIEKMALILQEILVACVRGDF